MLSSAVCRGMGAANAKAEPVSIDQAAATETSPALAAESPMGRIVASEAAAVDPPPCRDAETAPVAVAYSPAPPRPSWRFTSPDPMAVPDGYRHPDGSVDRSAALLRAMGLADLVAFATLKALSTRGTYGCLPLGALAYAGSVWPAAPSEGRHHSYVAAAVAAGNCGYLVRLGTHLNWCPIALSWRCCTLPAALFIVSHGHGSRHGHGSDNDYVRGRATVPAPPPQGLYVD